MHEEKWQVRFSECDDKRTLSYQGIVNYFQDCSNLHSEKLGVGMKTLEVSKKAWIMDFWQIVIKKRPEVFDNIAVCTWPNGFKGFFGTRNFLIKNEKEDVMVCANSHWVYYDREVQRPIKVSEDVINTYKIEPPYDMEYVERKIKVPDSMEFVGEFTVQKHHLDIYNHMNNAKYIEAACDFLKEGEDVWQICCQYRKQAVLSDVVRIFRTKVENSIYIIMKDTEDGIYATVKFDLI